MLGKAFKITWATSHLIILKYISFWQGIENLMNFLKKIQKILARLFAFSILNATCSI